MPRVELPEILLEVAARTGCIEAFTHLTERTARAADQFVYRADGGSLQHGTGAARTARHSSAQTRSTDVGRSKLRASRHADRL